MATARNSWLALAGPLVACGGGASPPAAPRGPVVAVAPQDPRPTAPADVPDLPAAKSCAETGEPCAFGGDFDGDARPDRAVLVERCDAPPEAAARCAIGLRFELAAGVRLQLGAGTPARWTSVELDDGSRALAEDADAPTDLGDFDLIVLPVAEDAIGAYVLVPRGGAHRRMRPPGLAGDAFLLDDGATASIVYLDGAGFAVLALDG